MSESYDDAVEALARRYAGVDAQRVEAQQWYQRQVAAAERARGEAEAAVAAAQAAVDAATELVDVIDAEVEEVWRTTLRRMGPAAARFGGPPQPVPLRPGEEYNPHQLIESATEVLDKGWRPGQMPRSQYPLLVLLSAVGAALAFGLREAVLWAGRAGGGDLAVGLPVLALVVTLVAPFVGLWPARVVADHRHVALDTRTIAVVVAAGIGTTVGLYLLA